LIKKIKIDLKKTRTVVDLQVATSYSNTYQNHCTATSRTTTTY